MRRLKQTLLVAELTAVAFLFGCLGLFLFLPTLHKLETTILPIQSDWKVTHWHVDNFDVLISGTATELRECPGRVTARDAETGMAFPVQPSDYTSKGQGESEWGPYRVVGGAGRPIELHTDFRCNPVWETQQMQGILDPRRGTK